MLPAVSADVLPSELRSVPLPRVFLVRQLFPRPRVEDLVEEVRQTLTRLALTERIRPGQTVALTAGSRGIAQIARIVKTTVEYLKEIGAQPFIVPAMGSHGGATAEGQRRVLESYGIREETVGAPIRSSMGVVLLGHTQQGIPIYCDRLAWEADHIAIINRVRPHTAYHGRVESGLLKMALIGLGKHVGAQQYHSAILKLGYESVLESVTSELLRRNKIAFGLAILENAYDEIAWVEAVRPEEFFTREPQLLDRARRWMPRLPFTRLDVLIVDRIGKNISGSGMDTNIVGRKRGAPPEAPLPEIRRIVVRDLTEETEGNATGIGLADFIHCRVAERLDHHATVVNCLAASHPFAATIPVCCDTDRTALTLALRTIGPVDPRRARLVRIPDTAHLELVYVSEAFEEELGHRPDLEVLAGPMELAFDIHGDLLPFEAQATGVVPSGSGPSTSAAHQVHQPHEA
jgi:hypothetical protein